MSNAKATIIAAIIGAVSVLICAGIALVPQIIALRQENSKLVEQNDVLQSETESNSETKATIASLEKRISELEASNASLREEKSQIETDYATVQKNYEYALSEIDRLSNGAASQQTGDSAAAQASANLSAEAVQLKDLSLVSQNKYYSQEKTSDGTPLNSYLFRYDAYAEFYLDGKYKTFTADIVPTPKTGDRANITVDIKLDYVSVFHQEGIKKNSSPIPVSIDLSGAQRMLIETSFVGTSDYNYINFVNTAVT